MKKPNIFIIGAPKCGTTFLAKSSWTSSAKTFANRIKKTTMMNPLVLTKVAA
jgi:hypothetical protein